MINKTEFAVALVHYPVLNRMGESTTTAITSMDVHDFARSCAMFDVAPVWFVHSAIGMHKMVDDIADYWRKGEGGRRNPGRKKALDQLRLAASLEDVIEQSGAYAWFTSAKPPVSDTIAIEHVGNTEGRHLIVFGTGWGLDHRHLPAPSGWLSPIEGIGMVRHLSVRAALAIYLDRLRRPPSRR